eukprot:gene16840-22325_t
MYRVLQSEGECVIGTWKSIDSLNISNNFREYLWKSNGSIGDMPEPMVMSDNHRDSSLLQLDLLDSGFSKVEDTFVDGYQSKWREFLVSTDGKRYYNKDNDIVTIEATANLAKCTK